MILNWDRTKPFTIDITVGSSHIDGYGHVSNHFFGAWMTDCMFSHSAYVGISEKICVGINRGMAVREMNVNLQAPAYEGDHLIIGNWIIASDTKLRASRQFQVINSGTGNTLVRAKMEFVCTNLKTGRPVKMPKIFAEKYAVESEILS